MLVTNSSWDLHNKKELTDNDYKTLYLNFNILKRFIEKKIASEDFKSIKKLYEWTLRQPRCIFSKEYYKIITILEFICIAENCIQKCSFDDGIFNYQLALHNSKNKDDLNFLLTIIYKRLGNAFHIKHTKTNDSFDLVSARHYYIKAGWEETLLVEILTDQLIRFFTDLKKSSQKEDNLDLNSIQNQLAEAAYYVETSKESNNAFYSLKNKETNTKYVQLSILDSLRNETNLQLHNDIVENLIRKGEDLEKEGKFEEALKIFEEALSLTDRDQKTFSTSRQKELELCNNDDYKEIECYKQQKINGFEVLENEVPIIFKASRFESDFETKFVSTRYLSSRLNISVSTIRHTVRIGEEYFTQWSKKKDPDNIAWKLVRKGDSAKFCHLFTRVKE